MSLVGDALSHGLLPGAAIAYLVAGPNPWALTVGALIAALVVAGLSSLLARTKRLPEDGAFAVIYLGALRRSCVAILGPGSARSRRWWRRCCSVRSRRWTRPA